MNSTLIGMKALDNTPRALNVSPDGQELFFTEAGVDAVQVLDLATSQTVEQIPVGTMPHWTATPADSSTAYVTNELSNDVSVVDLGNQTVAATIPVGNAPRKIAIQPTVPTTAAPMFEAD